jgi:8-amino-7-oxononanoate synthase
VPLDHDGTNETMDPLAWLDCELAELERNSLLRRLAVRDGPQRADRIVLGGIALSNFGSNDYLGLAAAPELAAAAHDAIAGHGWGSGASPLVTGRGTLHARLEEELAAFEGTEAALLFPSGYAANVGTIAALVGKGDAVFSDERNHASIIDGCRLSGASIHIYRHRDAGDVASLLAGVSARRKLVVTDTLFSMDGDIAPLSDLVELSRRHNAMLMVDEAHATGVFGPRGRGVCEQTGVENEVHVRVGTLSKALGCSGGFVAGSRRLVDWLANRARTYFFSTAPPEANAAAAMAALAIVRDQPQRRQELLSRAADLRQRLREAGLNTGGSESQIVPVILGEPQRTKAAAAALRQRGFFVPGIRPPSVPAGQSLLRISLSWLHTAEQIDNLVEALAAVAGS